MNELLDQSMKCKGTQNSQLPATDAKDRLKMRKKELNVRSVIHTMLSFVSLILVFFFSFSGFFFFFFFRANLYSTPFDSVFTFLSISPYTLNTDHCNGCGSLRTEYVLTPLLCPICHACTMHCRNCLTIYI